MPKLFRFIPGLQHWFSGTAILGALMTLYSVMVGFIQMPKEAGVLKWWGLAFGVVLSLAVWYSLAFSNAQSVKGASEQKERDASSKREQEERDALSEKRHLDDLAATEDIKVLSAKMLSAMEHFIALGARGVPSDNPQMQELAENVRVSAATIAGIVSFPAGGVFKLSGAPASTTVAESKAPIVVMPSVPSSGKRPS